MTAFLPAAVLSDRWGSPSRPLQFSFSSKNFFCPAFREEIREILASEYSRLSLACERSRISGCRFTPPKNNGGVKRQLEIRLRSQATFHSLPLLRAIELQSRTQLFRRDTSNLRGLSRSSPVPLLAFDVGGIHSVEIWPSKGVKCL